MSIKTAIDSISNHIEDIYNTLELGGEDLTNKDKNINNIYTNIKNRYKDYLANGTDMIWNNWENKSTQEGIGLNFSNTIEAKINTTLKGNSYQQTFTGKNVLNYNTIEKGRLDNGEIGYESGTTSLTTDTNSISFTTTTNYRGFVTDFISLQTSTYIIYSWINALLEQSVRFCFYDENKNYIEEKTTSVITNGKRVNNNVQNAKYLRLSIMANTTGTQTIIKPQIEFTNNTTQSAYEPYVGNKASPNPDYPQDIHIVTGNNTLKIIGKNLLNRAICEENKILTWADGVSFSSNGSLVSDYINAKANDQFAFNFKAQIMFYDKNKIYLGNLQNNYTIGTGTGREPISFTVPNDNNVYYIRLGFRKVSNDNIDMTTQNIIVNTSLTAATYEPYQEQSQLISLGDIELAKIGNYQDKIFHTVVGDSVYDSLDGTTKASLNMDSWYKQGNIGKFIATGADDEGWTYPSAKPTLHLTNFGLPNIIKPASNSGIYTTGLNNRYTMGYSYNKLLNTSTLTQGLAITSGGAFTILDENYLTTASFKEYLTTHNIVFYYVLKDTIYTEITDTTLIEQLNNLEKLKSYNNQTNILQSNNTDLPFIINATVLQQLT